MIDDDRIIKHGSFTEIQVDNENDLVEFVSGRYQVDRDPQAFTLFRGESDSAYRLTPSAFRPEGKQYLERLASLESGRFSSMAATHPDRQSILEHEAIAAFYRQADEAGILVPELPSTWRHAFWRQTPSWSMSRQIDGWPAPELWPLVALAQHYGVPTRLLDWTANPLVACYFAAAGGVRKQIAALSGKCFVGGRETHRRVAC